MHSFTKYLFIVIFYFFTSNAFGQELHVAPFDGTVYKLQNGRKYWKFQETYTDLPIINTIKWDKINVPSRDVENGFPDVARNGSFAIMFKTTFRATETAMYKFTLTSDDGTILWIDGKEIVNNDTEGAMHMKTDTVALTEGLHDMQIWYMQAFPTKYGIIFDYEYVDVPLKYDKEEILLDSDILFDVNSYTLNEAGLIDINKLIDKIKNRKGFLIRIIGHTDNIGSSRYNLSLSEKRANSLKYYVMSNLQGNRIISYRHSLTFSRSRK